MRLIGNILWFILVGFWQGLGWSVIGLLWSITIIGLPIGRQCFKLARLSFFPFGKILVQKRSRHILLNILWFIFGGFFLALSAFLHGLVLCGTIIGIPFGLQCFKLAHLALFPFGKVIE